MNGQYQLPESTTITKRLREKGFHHFVEKSTIDILLGNKFVSPITLHMTIGSMIQRYEYNAPYELTLADIMNKTARPLTPTSSDIIRLLLQDHPRIITILEQDGRFLKIT